MPGRIRIIGGNWRGRKLDVIEAEGLRPTPDRVRETLFNWLQPYIEGARCLDLFAGSGALAFEALSRGATAVTLIDNNPAVVACLKQQAVKLGAAAAEIVCMDAARWLQGCRQRFDIVFLDPPYLKNLLGQIAGQLLNCDGLHAGTLIYMESDREIGCDDERLKPRKAGKAGSVHYGLYEYTERPTI